MLKNTLRVIENDGHTKHREADEAATAQVRTLCLVDLENMACGAKLGKARVARLQRQICVTVGLSDHDQVVIATGGKNAFAAWYGWKGSAQRLMRPGRDGADLALLEAIRDHRKIAQRYQSVVIASGDHIFAPAVAALKALGLEVIVVAPPVGLSKQMRLAAGPDLKPLMFSFAHEIHAVYAQRQEIA